MADGNGQQPDPTISGNQTTDDDSGAKPWEDSARTAVLIPAENRAATARRQAELKARRDEQNRCPITGEPGTATLRPVPWSTRAAKVSDRGLAAALAALVASAQAEDILKATEYLTAQGVIDPDATYVVDPMRLASKSRNSPYAGRTLPGRVVHTLYAGSPTVLDGALA